MDRDELSRLISRPSAKIPLEEGVFHGVSGFRVPAFQKDLKRNHWSSLERRDVRYLLMHYTVIDFRTTAQVFTKDQSSGRVSAHYVIGQAEANTPLTKAPVLNFVQDAHIAWHAGLASWGGEKHLNRCAIGIEHVNPGFVEKGQKPPPWYGLSVQQDSSSRSWCQFDKDQMARSVALCAGIVKKYAIPPTHVLGHQDVSPGRKSDPGPLFPWESFARKGVGAWLFPEERNIDYICQHFHPQEKLPATPDALFFLEQLKIYGYEVDISKSFAKNRGAFGAFKAHFSGNQDLTHYAKTDLTQKDMFWIWGLNAKYRDYLPKF